MKFQPSPNSLFAILLRSRWWISFAVAGVIGLAAFALLPREIAPFAAIGALPIFVVGCIAAWRQWRALSPAQIEQALAGAASQPWKAFAETLTRAWQAEGYAVQRTDAVQTAYDFRLERNGQRTLVSARRWKAANHGVEPLRELQGALQSESAQRGVYVALHPLGDNARLYARDQGLVVLQEDALATLLAKA